MRFTKLYSVLFFLAILVVGLWMLFSWLYPSAHPALNNTLTPVFSTDPRARFAVIGDFGEGGTPEADVAALVKSWNPDFIVTTGDNNYPNGSPFSIDSHIGKYYREFIGSNSGNSGNNSNQNRFFPALGNHDWMSITCAFDPCRGPYFGYFSLPGNERYYDFIWGSVHFFVLDSDTQEPDGVSPDSVQGLWLKQRLSNSTATWKIVVLHHSPYSSGKEHGSIKYMRWPFQEWGASAVLSGHDHMYERLLVNGTPYFVNGLGGNQDIYSFNVPIPESDIRFNHDYGAMLVEANPQTLTFKFITRTGKLVDQFMLQSKELK
jgi:hypothetical protein